MEKKIIEPEQFTISRTDVPSENLADEPSILNNKIEFLNKKTDGSNNEISETKDNIGISETEENIEISETVVQEPVQQIFYRKNVFQNESLGKANESLEIQKNNSEAYDNEKLIESKTFQDDDSNTKKSFDIEAEFERLSINALEEFDIDLIEVEMSRLTDDKNEIQQKILFENHKENADKSLPFENAQIPEKKTKIFDSEVDLISSKIPFQNSCKKNTITLEDSKKMISEANNELTETIVLNKKDIQTDLLKNVKSEENPCMDGKQKNENSSIPKINVKDDELNIENCYDDLINEINDALLDLKSNQKFTNLAETEDVQNNQGIQNLGGIDVSNSQLIRKIVIDQITEPRNENSLSILDQNNTELESSNLSKTDIVIEILENNLLTSRPESNKKVVERILDVLEKKDFRNHTYVNVDLKNREYIKLLQSCENNSQLKDDKSQSETKKEKNLQTNQLTNDENSKANIDNDENFKLSHEKKGIISEPSIEKEEDLESTQLKVDEESITNNKNDDNLELNHENDDNSEKEEDLQLSNITNDKNSKNNIKKDKNLLESHENNDDSESEKEKKLEPNQLKVDENSKTKIENDENFKLSRENNSKLELETKKEENLQLSNITNDENFKTNIKNDENFKLSHENNDNLGSEAKKDENLQLSNNTNDENSKTNIKNDENLKLSHENNFNLESEKEENLESTQLKIDENIKININNDNNLLESHENIQELKTKKSENPESNFKNDETLEIIQKKDEKIDSIQKEDDNQLLIQEKSQNTEPILKKKFYF